MATKRKVLDKACPFCGSNNILDCGHGITCRGCGVWMGDGTQSQNFGGYKKLWNTRPTSETEGYLDVDHIVQCNKELRAESAIWISQRREFAQKVNELEAELENYRSMAEQAGATKAVADRDEWYQIASLLADRLPDLSKRTVDQELAWSAYCELRLKSKGLSITEPIRYDM